MNEGRPRLKWNQRGKRLKKQLENSKEERTGKRRKS
jgi:hypothetical protein